MRRLKVGDRVRVLVDAPLSANLVRKGDIGTVIYAGAGGFNYKVPGSFTSWGGVMKPGLFELVVEEPITEDPTAPAEHPALTYIKAELVRIAVPTLSWSADVRREALQNVLRHGFGLRAVIHTEPRVELVPIADEEASND